MSPARDKIFNQWYWEVSHLCQEVPTIIMGCKTDLHKNGSQVKKLRKNGLEPVTHPRGQEMAKARAQWLPELLSPAP